MKKEMKIILTIKEIVLMTQVIKLNRDSIRAPRLNDEPIIAAEKWGFIGALDLLSRWGARFYQHGKRPNSQVSVDFSGIEPLIPALVQLLLDDIKTNKINRKEIFNLLNKIEKIS